MTKNVFKLIKTEAIIFLFHITIISIFYFSMEILR